MSDTGNKNDPSKAVPAKDNPDPKPTPKLASAKRRSWWVVIAWLVVFGSVLSAGLAWWGKAEFERPGDFDAAQIINVPPGMGVAALARQLERQGVISDARIFTAGVLIKRKQGLVKAGEFKIAAGASMAEILAYLIDGKVVQHQITFAEGLTSLQVVQVLQNADVLSGGIAEIPKEGTLLPETYNAMRGDDRQIILNRMKRAQLGVMAQLWLKRAGGLPFSTPDEALVLASIVEKETGIDGERAHIAGVFINRLHKGMKLQSDPTIIYGLVGGKGRLDRALTRSDIASQSAYNTYVIAALPPAPICNPGRLSIAAVLNPLTTEDLYFVADGTGGHVFARTLAEHERNVAAWRKIEKRKNQP